MPLNSGFANVNGLKLYYETQGDGLPLVLIHGGLMDCRMWDDQFSTLAQNYRVVRYDLRDVAFSPDGKYIVTASFDGTARLWLTDIHDTIRAVCALLTRDLTPEERIQFNISDQEPTCPTP